MFKQFYEFKKHFNKKQNRRPKKGKKIQVSSSSLEETSSSSSLDIESEEENFKGHKKWMWGTDPIIPKL